MDKRWSPRKSVESLKDAMSKTVGIGEERRWTGIVAKVGPASEAEGAEGEVVGNRDCRCERSGGREKGRRWRRNRR